jgi:site-specific DNA-methyltransferase (adenine-specific)
MDSAPTPARPAAPSAPPPVAGATPAAAAPSIAPWFATEDGSFVLQCGDALELLPRLDVAGRVPLIFADPPYFLSNDGVTCQSGRMVRVNKGDWDRTPGIERVHLFNRAWLAACRELLTDDGTIWVSGTRHVIYSVGFAMQQLDFKLLNEIAWEKPNPPPNLSCRYFTHSTETVLWAARSPKSRHRFHYDLMKVAAGGKQMKSVWRLPAPGPREKVHGRHPTQKPLGLLERIVLASSDPGDLVLDPFCGSGTTGLAAARHGRRFIGIDSERAYLELARRRRAAQD